MAYNMTGLRIISGDLKGRKLFSIKCLTIRPTSGRLRESIFNILSNQVADSVVLDLFAGTGALGIEALSRGASFAIFIDSDKEAVLTISKNIKVCGLMDRTTIARFDISNNIIKSAHKLPAASLVFMDPPYNRNLVTPALINLSKSRILENNASIVIEHDVQETLPENISDYKITDQRRYGKTLVSFLKYMV
ncbi:MAG: 16S rRNA (guanine(966)-N(2))-methyltransferase RsmD [Desulfobacterium sp.]|nr:16S rRNA (guanine(966)-N(2))-methyltransferase RsmD [Desulfobacterium sp.]